MKRNPFDIYTSKIKRVNIPLPDFKFYHKSSSDEMVDEKFIGRDKISRRLYSWLVDERTKCGSYLVTGFRGMGKSSFVGRIMFELSAKTSSGLYRIGLALFIVMWISLAIAGISYLSKSAMAINDPLMLIVILAFCILSILILFKRYWIIGKWRITCLFVKLSMELLFGKEPLMQGDKRLSWAEKMRLLLQIARDYTQDWHQLNRIAHNAVVRKKSYRRICININLGQDVSHERDILSILAYELYAKYRMYVKSPIANFHSWLFMTFSISGAMFFCAKWIILNEEGLKNCFVLSFIHMVNWGTILMTGILVYWLIVRLLRLYPYSQYSVLRRLRFLCDRIDASVEIGDSIQARIDGGPMYQGIDIAAGHSRRNKYKPAQVREIEQELISVLDCITSGMMSPSFIFVFDELDKIDTDTDGQSKSNASPEFSNEINFPGGGTSRKRKQNVLHLLANMKLFISTAKAKFIFIAGRELYDAYLADLSDREFSVSSVFNGIIYVESFCSNERREKDIVSNTETYISKQLLPGSYVLKQTIRRYLQDKIDGKSFNGIDLSLKMYYKYLIEAYSKMYGIENLEAEFVGGNSCENGMQLMQNEVRACIDKAIVLLYHFSVYLYHISNGSPKKINLYFEKYIKSSRTVYNSYTLGRKGHASSSLSEPEINIQIDKKTKYFLSFGFVDQRNIGFIHYISFPVSQIIVNANQFGDKLLVSASFLIDHIYKYHHSGFSWRNLEHTPELLQVYRIPEFRGFINAIISYLTHTHLIAVSCGLYQYKFRKQFAEEISLASKFSEEIAALFNFTLDESQSVKQHYFELQQHYNEKLKQEKSSSPHEKAGIHHILADLYMSDEEYTKAILEYQVAYRIIVSQIPQSGQDDKHIITSILFLIRNMLKLGLAFEKRRTYESAYVTYNELIGWLISFRYLNEGNLNLKYVIKKKDEWPYHEAVLYENEQKTDKKDNSLNRERPTIMDNRTIEKEDGYKKFSTNGPNMISDLAHLMTTDGNAIIQRLSMLEDIRLIYQALLAKLFVQEKMELAGITRANIELIESEYAFLHLTTNDTNKFLISTDFFRRLGDIMYYKNGLTGYKVDSFAEGLYYGIYDSKIEVSDFCKEWGCFHIKDILLDTLEKIETKDVRNNAFKDGSFLRLIKDNWKTFHNSEIKYEEAESFVKVFYEKMCRRMDRISVEGVCRCNRHRSDLWKKNRPLPCFACKYYNRSLRILMKNLYDVDLETECHKKDISKTMVVLKCIVNGGTSKSLRQNHIMQLAEDLDCMGNIMLSCATDDDNQISKEFLEAFLADVGRRNEDKPTSNINDYQLYSRYYNDKVWLHKLERAILYFWEASDAFRFANDYKKAAGSLKKVLRTIQNYLRLAMEHNTSENREKRILLGEFLNGIKNHVIKQCLVYLYSHYNYINIMEIQKLKWIFSVQMYEDISLSRLSLFPDVEEVMLIYYDLIRCCVINKDNYLQQSLSGVQTSWTSLRERDVDFKIRLGGLCNNFSMGALRIESNIYGRVLSCRSKMEMNQQILFHLFSQSDIELQHCYYESFPNFYNHFVEFLDAYTFNSSSLTDMLGEYRHCFPAVVVKSGKQPNDPVLKFSLLEFLIKDSMFCLTRVFEIITPYTATTLFTNTFLAELYQKLFEWNQLFEALFMAYKVVDARGHEKQQEDNDRWQSRCLRSGHSSCPYSDNITAGMKNDEVKRTKSALCPHYSLPCQYKMSPLDVMTEKIAGSRLRQKLLDYQKSAKKYLADSFFNDVLHEIGKSHIHYTLSNFSAEMSLKMYRQALEMHREGKAYKEMISKMYFLDDDLKNDTIQFDSAIERYKINNDFVSRNMETVKSFFRSSFIYDIEKFCADNESSLPLDHRFI